MRRRISSRQTRISRRARLEPRQRWAPTPKDRWRLGWRAGTGVGLLRLDLRGDALHDPAVVALLLLLVVVFAVDVVVEGVGVLSPRARVEPGETEGRDPGQGPSHVLDDVAAPRLGDNVD